MGKRVTAVQAQMRKQRKHARHQRKMRKQITMKRDRVARNRKNS